MWVNSERNFQAYVQMQEKSTTKRNDQSFHIFLILKSTLFCNIKFDSKVATDHNTICLPLIHL